MIISMLFCLILFSDVFLSKLVFSKRVHLLFFLENDVIQAQIQGVGQAGQVKQLVAHFIFYDGSAIGAQTASYMGVHKSSQIKGNILRYFLFLCIYFMQPQLV